MTDQPIDNTASEEEQLQALLDQISSYIEQYHGGSVEMMGYNRSSKFESSSKKSSHSFFVIL